MRGRSPPRATVAQPGQRRPHRFQRDLARLRKQKPIAPQLEIYNLDTDPGETTDLAAAHPEIAERLQKIRSEAHRDPVAN